MKRLSIALLAAHCALALGGGAQAQGGTSAQAHANDCRARLIGDWRGGGLVRVFGAKTAIDNRYLLRADGGFEAVQRYRDKAGAWREQRAAGQWSAQRGAAADACDVTMTIRGEWGSATTITSFMLSGPRRFRFTEAEFYMVRFP